MTATIVIDDILPRTQATATSGQTVFDTNWTADVSSDVVVYARAAGSTPNDGDDLIDPSNYNVTFVGGSEEVRVTFTVGRTTGDIVTIVRNTPADRQNLYSNTNFTPSMLNGDFGRELFMIQQNELINAELSPKYYNSAVVDAGQVSPNYYGGDIYLPVLGASEFWVKDGSNNEITKLSVSDDLLLTGLTYLTYTDETAYLPNSLIGIPSPTNGRNFEFTAGDAITGASGTRISFTGNGSNTQHLEISGAVIRAAGTDANINVELEPKGNTSAIKVQNSDTVTEGRLNLFNPTSLSSYSFGLYGPNDTLSANYSIRFPAVQPTAHDVLVRDSGGPLHEMEWSTNLTSSITMPSGTTAQRGTATTGNWRFNTDTSLFEGYDGSTWISMNNAPTPTTDNAIARFDGTSGQLQNSGVIIDDSNNSTGTNTLRVGDITANATNTTVTIGGSTGNAIAATTNMTDAASKQGNFVIPHYTNAEEPFTIARGDCTLSENVASYGGGATSFNTATQLRFYTAANNTTLTGSERGRVDSSGMWMIGSTTSATNSQLTVVGTGTNAGVTVSGPLTDVTDKYGNFQTAHYTNAEEPLVIARGKSTVTENQISIGGGATYRNAATSIDFYTAANNTTLTGTRRGIVDSSGNWAFNTASNATNSNFNILNSTGGIFTSTSDMTNATTKNGSYAVPHHTNAQEPMCVASGQSSSGNNIVYFGGGSANLNAATDLYFYTATNAVTTTGSIRGRCNSSGQWFFNTTTAATNSNFNILNATSGIVTATDNMTNTTTKLATYSVPHYLNAEEPFGGMHLSAGTNNFLYLGGGTSNANAATRVSIYAAASTTTTTGSEIVRFDTNGMSFDAGTNFLDTYDAWADFTPSITCGTPGDLSVTYSVQYGRAMRVGDRCDFTIRIATTAFTHSTASGNLRIEGYPYTSRNSTNQITIHACTMKYLNKTSTPSWVQARMGSNVSYTSLQQSFVGGTAFIPITITDITSGVTPTIEITGSYEI